MPRLTPGPDQQQALSRLGDAIRARRHALKMSQEALADAAGINRTHMGEVERGRRNVSIIAVMAVSSALGCSLSELAGHANL